MHLVLALLPARCWSRQLVAMQMHSADAHCHRGLTRCKPRQHARHLGRLGHGLQPTQHAGTAPRDALHSSRAEPGSPRWWHKASLPAGGTAGVSCESPSHLTMALSQSSPPAAQPGLCQLEAGRRAAAAAGTMPTARTAAAHTCKQRQALLQGAQHSTALPARGRRTGGPPLWPTVCSVLRMQSQDCAADPAGVSQSPRAHPGVRRRLWRAPQRCRCPPPAG